MDNNTTKTITHIVDRLGVLAFSVATGGIVALALDITEKMEDSTNIIIGAIFALVPAIVVWGKQTWLESQAEGRKWEQVRIEGEFREKAERDRARRIFDLDVVRLQNEHERAMWTYRNEYMALSIERAKVRIETCSCQVESAPQPKEESFSGES